MHIKPQVEIIDFHIHQKKTNSRWQRSKSPEKNSRFPSPERESKFSDSNNKCN